MKKLKLLFEGSVLSMIKSYAKLGSSMGEKQAQFFKWQLKVAEPVKIESYKDYPELKEIVETFLKINKIKKKQCYYNAYKMTNFSKDISYVEGIADLVIPINHAWNEWNGIYFDITSEIVLKNDMKNSGEYVKIIEILKKDIYKFALGTETYGDWINYYFVTKILKEKWN